MKNKMRFLLGLLTLFVSACQSTPARLSETLIRVYANPAKGFNFAYFLEIPADSRDVLYVESNNTGFSSDDLGVHEASARKFIEGSYSRRIANRLRAPMLVPVFPRLASEPQVYAHYLNRKTLLAQDSIKRVDLQLVAMIADARERLASLGKPVTERVFMNGFSSSAGFALRFTALHPELVKAVAAGGINALPILPLASWKGEELRYPIGVADLASLAGRAFAAQDFARVPQYLYMGALDTNDTVPFRDSWDEDEAQFIGRVFGSRMQPDRWKLIQRIYSEVAPNVRFTTYPGVGHKVTPEIEDDLFKFFASQR